MAVVRLGKGAHSRPRASSVGTGGTVALTGVSATGSVGSVGLVGALTGAVYNFATTGLATFGVVFPEGAVQSGQGVTLGTFSTQNDVKTTWVDGSTRFVIVTANVTSTGNHVLGLGTAATGTISPSAPTASVALTVGGTTWTATYPGTFTDLWLNGPLVKEGRAFSSFIGATGTAAELRVRWDVRVYSTGENRVDVSVENMRNVSSAGIVYGGYSVTVNSIVEDTWTCTITNGPTNFSQSSNTLTAANHGLALGDIVELNNGTFPYSRRVDEVLSSSQVKIMYPFSGTHTSTAWKKVTFAHHYMTRWRKTYWTGATVEAEFEPDFTTFYEAGAFPTYLDTIDVPARTTAVPQFDILRIGNQNYPMNEVGAGGREDVGPYPRWVGQYLVGKRQDQRDYVLRNGDIAAGAWAAHATESDNTLYRLDAHPTWNMIKSAGGTLPLSVNLAPLHYIPEAGAAHEPSLAYVPYLLTGDRFFMDEMKFWGNRCVASWLGGRQNQQGLAVGQELRGVAWSVRNLTDAAAYTPDADPDKAYFLTLLNNNLTELDRLEQLEADPLGGTELGYSANLSAFQLSFFAFALEHARNQGFTSTGQFYLTRVLDWFLALFDPASGYDQDYIAFYTLEIRRTDTTFFSTYAQLWDYNWGPTGLNPGEEPDWVGSYGANIAMLMGIAIRLGLPSAQTYYNYSIAKTNGGVGDTVLDDLNERSAYALVPEDVVL